MRPACVLGSVLLGRPNLSLVVNHETGYAVRRLAAHRFRPSSGPSLQAHSVGTRSERNLDFLPEPIALPANSAIWEAAGTNDQQAGMGSTVVSVLVDQDYFTIGHVGDSRVYLIREDAILQLTQDHSLVAQQRQLGLISFEEAKTSPLQSIIRLTANGDYAASWNDFAQDALLKSKINLAIIGSRRSASC